MTKERVDGEEVTVVRTQALEQAPPTVDLVTQGQTERGAILFEERVKGARRMLRAALQLTQPGQWMVYGEGDKQSVYATAGAAERVLRQGFGLRWGEKTVTVEDVETAIVATCTADLLNPDGSVYERFLGTRRGDFKDNGDIKGYLKDEQALMKGAIANMKHRAVTAILGLTFLTPQDFKELGLDLGKLTRKVEFQDHDHPEDPGELTVPFGKNKGKHPRELGDKSLEWYLGAALESVADPSKAKWRDKNQAWLEALQGEVARRGAVDETPT